jgi:hypothetical protein
MFALLRLHPLLTQDALTLLGILAALTLALQLPSLLAQRELSRLFLIAVSVSFALAAVLLSGGGWMATARLAPSAAIALAGVGVGLGAIVRVTRGQLTVERLGGLIVKLPITGTALALSMLSASGIPFTGVGTALRAGDASGYVATSWMSWAPGVVVALLSLGLIRAWLLSFFGPTRHLRTHARAGEAPLLWGSCAAAAVFAVLCGFEWFPLRFLVDQSPSEAARLVAAEIGSAVATSRPESVMPDVVGSDGTSLTQWGWLIGATIAGVWWRGSWSFRTPASRPATEWTVLVLRDGFFFDDFYRALVGGVGVMLADALARLDDWLSRAGVALTSAAPARLACLFARVDERLLSGQTSPRVVQAWPWTTLGAMLVGVAGAAWILLR